MQESKAELAHRIGMAPAALDDVLDCIESKYSVQYLRNMLRTLHKTRMSHEQWRAIKEWAAKLAKVGK